MYACSTMGDPPLCRRGIAILTSELQHWGWPTEQEEFLVVLLVSWCLGAEGAAATREAAAAKAKRVENCILEIMRVVGGLGVLKVQRCV